MDATSLNFARLVFKTKMATAHQLPETLQKKKNLPFNSIWIFLIFFLVAILITTPSQLFQWATSWITSLWPFVTPGPLTQLPWFRFWQLWLKSRDHWLILCIDSCWLGPAWSVLTWKLPNEPNKSSPWYNMGHIHYKIDEISRSSWPIFSSCNRTNQQIYKSSIFNLSTWERWTIENFTP